MKILVTGAKGFVGRNLCSQLNNIKTGKAKCYGCLLYTSDKHDYKKLLAAEFSAAEYRAWNEHAVKEFL